MDLRIYFQMFSITYMFQSFHMLKYVIVSREVDDVDRVRTDGDSRGHIYIITVAIA